MYGDLKKIQALLKKQELIQLYRYITKKVMAVMSMNVERRQKQLTNPLAISVQHLNLLQKDLTPNFMGIQLPLSFLMLCSDMVDCFGVPW